MPGKHRQRPTKGIRTPEWCAAHGERLRALIAKKRAAAAIPSAIKDERRKAAQQQAKIHEAERERLQTLYVQRSRGLAPADDAMWTTERRLAMHQHAPAPAAVPALVDNTRSANWTPAMREAQSQRQRAMWAQRRAAKQAKAESETESETEDEQVPVPKHRRVVRFVIGGEAINFTLGGRASTAVDAHAQVGIESAAQQLVALATPPASPVAVVEAQQPIAAIVVEQPIAAVEEKQPIAAAAAIIVEEKQPIAAAAAIIVEEKQPIATDVEDEQQQSIATDEEKTMEELEEALGKIRGLKTAYHAIRTESNQARIALSAQRSAHKTEIKTLKAQLANKEKELAHVRSTLQSACGHHATLKRAFQTTKDDLTGSRALVQALRHDCDMAHRRNTELAEHARTLSAENKRLLERALELEAQNGCMKGVLKYAQEVTDRLHSTMANQVEEEEEEEAPAVQQQQNKRPRSLIQELYQAQSKAAKYD